MAQRFSNPRPRMLTDNANPLSGGLLYFYEADQVTPKTTYSDNALSTANANPVVLSSGGLAPNIFLDGPYYVVLEDSNGVQLWAAPSVNSVVDSAFAAWDSSVTYGVGGLNIVYASNGKYYISILAPNLANEPSASPTYWKLFIDYLMPDQTNVDPGFIAIGNATTGLAGIDTTAKGSMPVGNGTTTAVVAVGTNGQVWTADSTADEGAAWDDLPAGLTAASQTEMEAASSNTVAGTPGNMNWHPAMAKVLLNCNGAGTTITNSYNVTSITDTGTGDLLVTFNVDFSGTTYYPVFGVTGQPIVLSVGTKAAGTCQILGYDGSGTPTDPTTYYVAFFGDQ